MAENEDTINEPTLSYEVASIKKRITFFNSFEEAAIHGLKQMARHSYEERLNNLDILRKRTYSHLLLPDGSWPPLKRVISIDKPSYL